MKIQYLVLSKESTNYTDYIVSSNYEYTWQFLTKGVFEKDGIL